MAQAQRACVGDVHGKFMSAKKRFRLESFDAIQFYVHIVRHSNQRAKTYLHVTLVIKWHSWAAALLSTCQRILEKMFQKF